MSFDPAAAAAVDPAAAAAFAASASPAAADLELAGSVQSMDELTKEDKTKHNTFIEGLLLNPFNPQSSQRGQRNTSRFKTESPKNVLEKRKSANNVSELETEPWWLLRVVPVYQAFAYDAAGVMGAVDNPTHWGESGLRTVFFGCITSQDYVNKDSIYGTVASHCSLQKALRWYYKSVCEAPATKATKKTKFRMYFVSKHSYGVERSYTVLISCDKIKLAGAVPVPSAGSPAAADGLPHLIEFVGSPDDGFEDAHFLFRPCETDNVTGCTLLTLAFHFPSAPARSAVAPRVLGFPMRLFKRQFVTKRTFKGSQSFPQDDDVDAYHAKFVLMKAKQLFLGAEYTKQVLAEMDAPITESIRSIIDQEADKFRRLGVKRTGDTLMTVASAARSYLGLSKIGQLVRAKSTKTNSLLHLGRLFGELQEWSAIFGNAPFVDDKTWWTNMRAWFKKFKPNMGEPEKAVLHEQIKQKPTAADATKAIRDYCWLMAKIAYDPKSRDAWMQMLCLLVIPVKDDEEEEEDDDEEEEPAPAPVKQSKKQAAAAPAAAPAAKSSKAAAAAAAAAPSKKAASPASAAAPAAAKASKKRKEATEPEDAEEVSDAPAASPAKKHHE